MPKCIRCGKEERTYSGDINKWKMVEPANGGDWSLACLGTTLYWGLCPDCQLPEKKVYKGMTGEETEYFCGEIRNLEDCLKTQEKRIAANERQIERLWEVIKCLGEKG